MKKKVLFFLGCAAIVFLLTLNLNLASFQNGNFRISLSSLINQALATGEGGTVYKWSNSIDCPGLGNGDYQVCQVNGYQNVCTNPGARTCNCGSSKNFNDDGNCD